MATRLFSACRSFAPFVLFALVAPACGDTRAKPSVGVGTAAISTSDPVNYDPHLDNADAAIEKAIALLQEVHAAAMDASAPNGYKPYGGHDEKAIFDLQKARDEIYKAKVYADQNYTP